MTTRIDRMTKSSHHRTMMSATCLGFYLTCLCILLSIPAGVAVAAQAEPARKELEKPAAKLPVILLTGFEPFGEKRTPNPSWEGIKELDGKEWKGYRLACRQAKVVWGEPVKQLGAWIDELQPAAVFSFGEGGRGTFYLETRARNHRARVKDNLGEKPASPTIVGDGPKVFEATVDSFKLADLLIDKGYPLYISRNAGRYLCEEALYSLEYLKSTRKLTAPVLFCHVPSLGSRISRKETVTAAYVQKFVTDMLDSWYTVCHEQTKSGPTADWAHPDADDSDTGPVKAVPVKVILVKATQTKAQDERVGEVKEFIENYFRTWSEQDMNGYDGCFLTDACIQFIDPRGALKTTGRARFVAEQREFHRTSRVRTIEVPETIEVRFEGRLANAIAFWKLTSGSRIQKGYDHFTLMKQDGRWRIINLVFYATSDER